jgi:methyltransferase (TIGR00027 family)
MVAFRCLEILSAEISSYGKERLKMKKTQASLTSEGIAIARVLEFERPKEQRICNDPFARRLISPGFYILGKLFADYGERRGPGVIGFLVARCRYIDDYLQQCLDAGIEQLVIMGAGLDSRAYRFEKLKGKVKAFEVDHPATQMVKLKKLRKIFGTIPEHVIYVPVDFNEETLQKLFNFGFKRELKTLFIWEGVVHYLSEQAVDQTLEFVLRNSASGSKIIFDYLYASALDTNHKRGEIERMQRVRRFTGEGLTFGIEEGQVEEFLHKRGFIQIQNVTSEDLKKAYFTGVNQSRAVAPIYAIAHASVK